MTDDDIVANGITEEVTPLILKEPATRILEL
jgi:hypothetical protein